MRQRLEQLRSLAPWERWMLVQLVVLLPAIGFSLRLLGYGRTRDLLRRSSSLALAPEQLSSTRVRDTAHRISRLVGIAANHGPYQATCLRQSLALWWLLRRRGIAAKLRIGVRKDGSDLNAHAWVEHCGTPLGREYPGYTPFADPDFGDPA